MHQLRSFTPSGQLFDINGRSWRQSIVQNLISDSAVLLCFSRISGGRRHRAWAGNQQLKLAELHHVSCFVTEITDVLLTDDKLISKWQDRAFNRGFEIVFLHSVDMNPLSNLSKNVVWSPDRMFYLVFSVSPAIGNDWLTKQYEAKGSEMLCLPIL